MKQIYETLARLASLPYQQNFILNASKDEYELPEQLIDEVIQSLSTVLNNTFETVQVSKVKQIESIKLLHSNLQILSENINFDDIELSNEQLVLHNKHWREARNKAFEFLKEIEFDIRTWETDNIKSEKI